MKKSALCYFCKNRITDRRDYVIFTLPRLKGRYTVSHRACHVEYLAKHLQGPNLSYYRPIISVLNSATTWFFCFLLIALSIFSLLWSNSVIKDNPNLIMPYLYFILPVVFTGIAIFYIFLRLFFYLKYEKS